MANHGREIVTLQFGHYSNFVGAHWWNLQEAGFTYNVESVTDINNDVLFREGETSRGEVTFTPRLVLADLKGSLGALSEDGGLYEKRQRPDPSLVLWPEDKVKIEAAAQLEKNEFLNDLDQLETSEVVNGITKEQQVIPKEYNLDDSVNVWSDYLRTLFHPRSLAITNKYKHNDEQQPFSYHGLGNLLWKVPSYQEDITERIRAYVEEADNLQGFHVLLDGHDGFSGLACSSLQYLNDEYSSKAVLAFICQPSFFDCTTKAEASKRVLNLALTAGSLPELSSLFCPISTVEEGWRQPKNSRFYPHLNYNDTLHYHSSAILASGLETLSLTYRLRNSVTRLKDVTSGLRVVGRAAAAASVTLPFPMTVGSSLLQTLESWNGPLFNSITPYCQFEKVDLQSVVLRGVSKNRLIGKLPDKADLSNPAYNCRSVEEMLSLFVSCSTYPSPTTRVASSTTMLHTYEPFPHIFNEDLISHNGSLSEYIDPHRKTGVQEVPVLAGLHSTETLSTMLESLHEEAKKINLRHLPGFYDSGLENIDCDEKLEQLLCLSECYSSHEEI